MTQSEISANYGVIFQNAASTGGKTYISEKVNLKFIPDKVSLDQYITVLLKSPDYLLKFWNSVILVVPIVVFQVAIASIAAYGFTRWRGKVRAAIFFFYVILMLMPYQVTLVPNYLVSQWLHILNTRWAISPAGRLRALLGVPAHQVHAQDTVLAHRGRQDRRRGRVAGVLPGLHATVPQRRCIPSRYSCLSTIGTWSSSR